MAETKLVQAGDLKVGSYVIFDGIACVVKDIQTSKTGKHGSSKCRIEAVGLINSQKKIQLCPSSDNIQVPIIEKKNAQVLSVHGDTATVMDNETFETFEIKISEEHKEAVKEGSVVNYWVIMDEKVIMQVK
ncbi:translation initiation factor IF-5A [Candidatus Woesearchaeota archaeon]|nr:translation initiation factor IF-5A [Candidatus Woesearchaeota archaeon]